MINGIIMEVLNGVNGKNIYFYGLFSMAMLNKQRVTTSG